MSETINYPATYRAPIFRRIASAAHVLFITLLAFFGRAHLENSSSSIVWAFAVVGLIFIVVWKFNDSSRIITLHTDRIEQKSWFSTKTWRRDEAAGIWYGLFGSFRLVRKYNKGDYFIIPAGIYRDATWNDWLRDVPEANIKPLFPRIFRKHRAHQS
ncbi:hypothetical protein ACQKQD_33110 [Methylobacterium sp. NPDC080182]|uniref:hypothetical protein n=1 Tax=Methylobacterium sp. NPDC080182 TaxID=3390590 RepID=UPI003D039092